MDIALIKKMLSDQPHITQVWVTDEGYFTAPVNDSILLELDDIHEENAEDLGIETTTKTRKKKTHGA